MTKKHIFRSQQIKSPPEGLPQFCILQFDFCIFLHAIRSTKDYVRKNKLFLQNKANFRKVKLTVNKVLTRDYEEMDTWSIGKTKPIKANSKPIQSQLKPIKCQNKPNSNPIYRGVAPGEAGTKPISGPKNPAKSLTRRYSRGCLLHRILHCKQMLEREQLWLIHY